MNSSSLLQAPLRRSANDGTWFLIPTPCEPLPSSSPSPQPLQYAILVNGDVRVDGIDDAADFEDVRNAMGTLGIGPEEREDFFRLLAAILHLGNLQFEGEDVV